MEQCELNHHRLTQLIDSSSKNEIWPINIRTTLIDFLMVVLVLGSTSGDVRQVNLVYSKFGVP